MTDDWQPIYLYGTVEHLHALELSHFGTNEDGELARPANVYRWSNQAMWPQRIITEDTDEGPQERLEYIEGRDDVGVFLCLRAEEGQAAWAVADADPGVVALRVGHEIIDRFELQEIFPEHFPVGDRVDAVIQH